MSWEYGVHQNGDRGYLTPRGARSHYRYGYQVGDAEPRYLGIVDANAEKKAAQRGSCDCPALINGRCSVYAARPLICRLWGAVESMPCPHGCTVTPGLLMDAGAQTLIARSLRIGGDA